MKCHLPFWCNVFRTAGLEFFATDNFPGTFVDFCFMSAQGRISTYIDPCLGVFQSTVFKVSFTCWEQTLNITLIKQISEWHFRKLTIAMTKFALTQMSFLTEKRYLHTIRRPSLLKTKVSYFLFFVSWNLALYLHVWVMSIFFPDNSDLAIVIDFHFLHETVVNYYVFLTGFIQKCSCCSTKLY